MTSIDNWITDLNFAKTMPYPNVPGAEVHQGFFGAFETISSALINSVSMLVSRNKGYPIYVTGHSLGAALAVLGVLQIVNNVSLTPTIYTYGDPRVGNSDFASYFDSKIGASWRVVNQNDIVPHLPPEILDFYHVSTEVWYESEAYQVCDSSGEDPNCSDSVPFIKWSIPEHVDYMGVQMGTEQC